MNRRDAVITGLASLAAAVGIQPDANAQTSDAETANPELDPLRTLLAAYDGAFTNQDIDGVMATLSEKAAIMGTGPGEIWSGPDEIKAAFEAMDAYAGTYEYDEATGAATHHVEDRQRFFREAFGDAVENRRQDCSRFPLPVLCHPQAGKTQCGPQLLDKVVSSLLHVGLSLQAAIDLPHRTARQRITEALQHLDDTIHEIRDHMFAASGQQNPPHRESPDDAN